MCARFSQNGRTYKPGDECFVVADSDNPQAVIWVGFARREKLRWWKDSKGAAMVGIAAETFAERADDDKELVWARLQPATYIMGIVTETNQMRVVTRAVSPEEHSAFRHDRLPLLLEPARDRSRGRAFDPVKTPSYELQ